MGLVELGAGEGIEDPAAGIAAVVDDRGAMASMDLQVIAAPAAQADQTAGVEDGDEFGIAGVLVHEFRDGKVHDYAP